MQSFSPAALNSSFDTSSRWLRPLIDAAKAKFPIDRLCVYAAGSASASAAISPGRIGPPAGANATDMVLLAHVCSAFALSSGAYGSPRRTRALQDAGLLVGRRRSARLMRETGLRARQKRRFHADHGQPSRLAGRCETARSGLHQPGLTRNGAPASPRFGPAKAGCTSPSSSTCSPAGWSAGDRRPVASGPGSRGPAQGSGQASPGSWHSRRGTATSSRRYG
jgi:HTH-like domain